MNTNTWPFVPTWPVFPHPESSWPFPTSAKPDGYSEAKLEKLDDHEDSGIKILHCFDSHRNRGGVCVAYRITAGFKNTRMVEVSTSYCSPHDSYSRKIGAKKALDRFLNGHTILVPCGDTDDLMVRYNLEKMFFWS